MKSTLPFVLSLVAYLVSLGFPALHGVRYTLPGFSLLLLGRVQAVDGDCFAWISNMAYFGSVICFLVRQYRLAAYSAVAACVIGFDTFRASGFPANSGVETVPILSIGGAFYIWQLSFVLLVVASYVRAAATNSLNPNLLRKSD